MSGGPNGGLSLGAPSLPTVTPFSKPLSPAGWAAERLGHSARTRAENGSWACGRFANVSAASSRGQARRFSERVSKAYIEKDQPLLGLTYVATQSPDGKKTFLHLFLPPKGRSVQLPAPADGRRFSSASLLGSGNKVSLSQTETEVVLTLGQADHWDDVDTIIVLE